MSTTLDSRSLPRSLSRRAGLEVSIHDGGHDVAGRAVADGSVMIDLAELKGIAVARRGAAR